MLKVNSSRYLFRREHFGGILLDKKKKRYYHVNKKLADFLCGEIDPDLSKAIIEKTKLEDLFVQASYDLSSHNGNSKSKRGLSAPLRLLLYPTLQCNVSCRFCYLDEQLKKTKSIMTYREFLKIIEIVQEWRIPEIEFLGGEPFLVPWLVKALVYSSDQDISSSVVTNGTLLTEEQASKISSLSNSVGFVVSFHGDKKTHNAITNSDAYNKVLNTIRLLADHGIPYEVCSTVSRLNIKSMLKLADLLARLEVNNWRLLHAEPLGCNRYSIPVSIKEFVQLHNELKRYIGEKKYRIKLNAEGPFRFTYSQPEVPKNELERIMWTCAIKRRLEVLPNGDVFPCCWFFGKSEYCLGNIFLNSFDGIWNNTIRENLGKDIGKECDNACKFSDVCCGCIGYRKTYGKQKDDRCPLHS